MTLPSPTPQIAIIGGGPAGLMAAERLAATGGTVTIYDRMPSIGRKFLMAGRGGLNLTHSEGLGEGLGGDLDKFVSHYGAAAPWLKPVIEHFPPAALCKWCEGLGQELFIGSSGRVFPKAMKASPLLRAWLRRLENLGVKFALRHRWKGWDAAGDLIFADAQGKNITVKADATVLAMGGASWPRLGSDGGWVEILRSQNISVSNLRPSNCGFVVSWSEHFTKNFAGQPVKPVMLSFSSHIIQGELMITEQGLEGGAIYALSSTLRQEIEEKGEAILSIDLRPGLSIEELTHRLDAPRGSQSASTWLRKAAGLSPVAIGLVRENLGKDLPTDPAILATAIKATKIRLTATAPIAHAISSAGGVTRDALDKNFMLKQKPGVFVCGEMLDWEAPTGGYLLQACFGTAVTVSDGVKSHLSQK